MSNFRQNYNFNQSPDIPPYQTGIPYEYLKAQEDKRVNTCFYIWIACLLASIITPALSVLMYIALYLDSMGLWARLSDLFSSPLMGIVSLITSFARIGQHFTAILCKINYPNNEKARKLFIVDMVLLGVAAIIYIVGFIVMGIACGYCVHEMDDCG